MGGMLQRGRFPTHPLHSAQHPQQLLEHSGPITGRVPPMAWSSPSHLGPCTICATWRGSRPAQPRAMSLQAGLSCDQCVQCWDLKPGCDIQFPKGILENMCLGSIPDNQNKVKVSQSKSKGSLTVDKLSLWIQTQESDGYIEWKIKTGFDK